MMPDSRKLRNMSYAERAKIMDAAEAKFVNHPARQRWLNSSPGRRWSELRSLYLRSPSEAAEYERLQRQYMEADMSTSEKVEYREELKEWAAEDSVADREEEEYSE